MKFFYCGAVTVVADPRTRQIEFLEADAPADILQRCRLWAESEIEDLLKNGYELIV